MPINFSQYTLKKYLEQLSSREPVPGGGSAAALTGSVGVGLVLMVTRYSLGRKSNTKLIERRLEKIFQVASKYQERLLELSSLDAQAYLGLSLAKQADKKSQLAAKRFARQVPQEVCDLCEKAIKLTPYLVEKGNPYLLSDVEVAIELLFAAFNGAKVMVRVNT